MADDSLAEESGRVPQTITRQALGRIAKIGDLYNSATEKFLGLSMLREQLPKDSPAIAITDNKQCNISVTTVSTYSEKMDKMNVTSDLKLSVLVGMCEVNGSAKYLTEKKSNFKSVESSLLYNLTTVVEQLNLSSDKLMPYVSSNDLSETGATHVVVGIHWGANCAITMTDQNKEDKSVKDVEANLSANMEKLKVIVSASASVGMKKDKKETDSFHSFTLKTFADMLPEGAEEIPHTYEGALAMVQKMPVMLKNCNDGKGKPLAYILLPLIYVPFRDKLGLKDMKREIGTLEGGDIVQVLQIFDLVTQMRQKVHDYHDRLLTFNVYPTYYVIDSELEYILSFEKFFDLEEANLRSKTRMLASEIRAQKKGVECLNAFCDEHTVFFKKKFEECEVVYEAIRTRVHYVKLCKRYGVKLAKVSVGIHQQIFKASINDEHVFVLFDGTGDYNNRCTFFEIVKNSHHDDETICYVTWSKPNEVARIEHYRKGILINADVAKELTTKDVAQSVTTGSLAEGAGTEADFKYLHKGSEKAKERKARKGGERELEIEFKASCPGSYYAGCSKEGRTWTCIKCDELLRFRRKSSEVFCSCGFWKLGMLRFHCRSAAHGSEFMAFSDDVERALVLGLTWMPFSPGEIQLTAAHFITVGLVMPS